MPAEKRPAEKRAGAQVDTPGAAPLLEIQHVSYAYAPGAPVLHDVTFALAPGELLFLLGQNGSGKTTLLSCAGGVLRPTVGRVLLNGADIRAYAPAARARQIGLVPQIHIPAFAYTAHEMVVMGRAPHLGLLGSPGRRDDEIADAALEAVGLAALRDRAYTALSGGERQLVMIARGLAQQSRILLLDEPGAHLDPKNQHRVLEIVARLARDEGIAFIVASHAPNDALLYADRVLLLKGGRALALGDTLDILSDALLSAAYDIETEIIYAQSDEQNGDSRIPRAVVPRRTARRRRR